MLLQSDDDKKKKKKLKPTYNNPFEAFQDIGRGMADQTKNQFTEGAKTAVNQILFGGEKPQQHGELMPGQEFDLKAHEENKKIEAQAHNIEPGINYVGEILKSHENVESEETKDLQKDIQNLILEIKSLAGATNQLEKQVTEATGQIVVSPGKYHKSFFRWVFSVIRDARTKIDSAGSFLTAMKGKQQKGLMMGKSKKTNYWDMAEEHGMVNFTLSGERAVSNQVG